MVGIEYGNSKVRVTNNRSRVAVVVTRESSYAFSAS